METTFSGLSLSVGMKIYDNDWFLRHQLEPEQAADVLKAMGRHMGDRADSFLADGGFRWKGPILAAFLHLN